MYINSQDPFQTPKGWYTYRMNTGQCIGPYPSKNAAFLASCLGTSVEELTASMIKEGLVDDDDGQPLKPEDFENWSSLRPEYQ